MTLFGKLTDLEKLQIYNFRSLNDEMAAQLAGLSKLTSLALTNSVINDATVEMIAKSFPNLTDLDLSSNTNLTNSVMKVICSLSKLQRLAVVQNRFNDLGTRRLSRLADLRVLDLRGNMEAADMTMDVVAGLPKLTGLKHRSTAVSDAGMESPEQEPDAGFAADPGLRRDQPVGTTSGQTPETDSTGDFSLSGVRIRWLAGSQGMKLTRLTLRDLPMIDDRALAVLADLPELRRLYVHEIASISDSGLQHLASLKSLEVLDIWTVPQMTDATVDIIAALPNLKELSIRTTGVTDAAVDKLLGMKSLQSLTFKQNGQVSDEGLRSSRAGNGRSSILVRRKATRASLPQSGELKGTADALLISTRRTSGHVPDPRKRPGTIKAIVEYTGLDRHQVAALLKNEVKYIPMQALSRLCDYLIEYGYVSGDQLPGALFAVEPEHFWELLARRRRLEMCLGVRRGEEDEWPAGAWVVASDSVLLGELLNGVSTLGGTAKHLRRDRGASTP